MLTVIGGFLMALADSVPGVSGGTIAFIMGFYDEFVSAVSNILKGTKEEKKKALLFLVKMGLGWGCGMILAVLLLSSIFEKNIYQISSMFLGFVLAAIPLVIYEERATLKKKLWGMLFIPVGIAVVVGITVLNSSASDSGAFTLSIGSAIYLFICGAVAICAMVLPGISGSTLLLIFGLYMTVISSVKEVLHLNLMPALPICIIFGLGVLFGLACFIGILKKCLSRFRAQTIFLVIGLMFGSLYAIVMGPESLDNPVPAMTFDTFSIVFFFIGIAVIALLQVLKIMIERKQKKPAEVSK